MRRWVVDISKWDPQPYEFSFALSLLPSQEHSSVTRYYTFYSLNLVIQINGFLTFTFARFFKMEDRKRALISRMLQYALLYDLVKINKPFFSQHNFIIQRTSQAKPFLDLLVSINQLLSSYIISYHNMT